MKPITLVPQMSLDIDHWSAECLAALHKLSIEDFLKRYIERNFIEQLTLCRPPLDFYPEYLPRATDALCELDTPLEAIFSTKPLIASIDRPDYVPSHVPEDEWLESSQWFERSAMLSHLMARFQDGWSIVDQNKFTQKNADLYTGCWFDFAVTNALHNYPRIAANMRSILRKYALDDAHKRPCELIRALRMAFLVEVEKRYHEPAISRLVKILVFRYLEVNLLPGYFDVTEAAQRIFKHMVSQLDSNIEDPESYSRSQSIEIMERLFERGLEIEDRIHGSYYANMFKDDDFILNIWITHVFHEMATTNGADRLYTQLISLIFDFTTIEVDLVCDNFTFTIFMELIHTDPQAAYKILHPGMRVSRICNLPEDLTDLDARTMFAFSLRNGEKGSGHAMFITRGQCETKWVAPLN
jgi:hypothetical protein